MIALADISLPLTVEPLKTPASAEVRRAVLHVLRAAGWQGTDASLGLVEVLRVGVDARRGEVHFVATVGVEFPDEDDEQALVDKLTARKVKAKIHVPDAPLPRSYAVKGVPEAANAEAAEGTEGKTPSPSALSSASRFLVVGAGPAGLFAALTLAEAGLRPILIERGGTVAERMAAVEQFNQTGELDPECNVAFGEGGAGTFSDGKLNTGIKSPLLRGVLQTFIDCGADPVIARLARPHVGTDVLRGVVENLRARIIAAGGEVRFHTRLERLVVRDGAVCGAVVTTDGGLETLACDRVLLACGHSAADTISALYAQGVAMQRKPFSLGVRIEHPQAAINESRDGGASATIAKLCPPLAAADYKLVHHCANGRSVYSFCMCPGGEVVCASSTPGGIVVNGMSNFARDGEVANAALLVDVRTDDFGPESAGPLAGFALQQKVERAAYDVAHTKAIARAKGTEGAEG